MSTPNVLALDLSLTGTGWASHGIHTGVHVGTLNTRDLRGHTRIAQIVGTIARKVYVVKPHLVLIEGQYHTQRGSDMDIIELHGVVKFFLGPRVPYLLIAPSKLKVFATGKGKDVAKTAVALEVERRYGHRIKVADDNQADAFVMLAMAMYHYGAPLAPLPQTYTRALAGVDWPVLAACETAQSADFSLDLSSADRASNQ